MSEKKEFQEIPLTVEQKKRRKEIFIIFLASFLFVFLTWFEIRLFTTSQQLPFVHSIFFFGLVNFNIVLLLLLMFLIFRNVVKVFVERQGRIFGSSLKGKLIAAFLTFSAVPTILMFIISVFYINSSFDKWFSVKMVGVLKSSLEVQNAYYFNAKKKNYHFAHQVADRLKSASSRKDIQNVLRSKQKDFALDAVEFYPSLFSSREMAVSKDENIGEIPPVSLEFLQKGIRSKIESSTIYQYGDGNLVRVIVPVDEESERGAVVVSSFVPLSLISRMNDVSAAYEEFRDVNPLEYPLKSIYLIILFLMTLVILLAATWFGFHLAKQLSIPLFQLGRATQRVASGDYIHLNMSSGSEEISSLIANFNQMTSNLSQSEKEVKAANANLRETLNYIEVVLKNVSAGVISIDRNGKITTVNRHASELLGIDATKFLGHSVREILTLEYFRTFAELLKTMQTHNVESLQREIKVNVQGQSIPLLMNLSILKDENGQELGKVLVFDDLTAIVNAQRAAAWTEVARRIAHEVKNPLTPIKLSAERLQKKFGHQIQDPAFKECTTMIIQQVDDMKNLVNEFSQFSRLPQSRPVVGSLHEVIQESLVLFKQAHSQIQYHIEFDPHVPDFKFDPHQMKRVFTNLIANSVEAASKEANPIVKVRTVFDAQLKILRAFVEDNGPGIPVGDRQRIFDPYFSTKETGTGLGLAIVKRIIEDHNGLIRAQSNEPSGTRMMMEIPIVDSQSLKSIPTGNEV